ncbi:MAG TPA: prolyl oligopeptidase family serine peptidase, partial [Thermoanaerobaculia bacterium]|nr:prolyl oligopeptidase family serine peptidase [Thermoanaerobaculia bacterium]
MTRARFVPLAAALLALLPSSLRAETRPLRPDDVWAFRDVDDPHLSPDGRWVAYKVTSQDRQEDRADADLWMVPFGAPSAGGEAVRLTSSPKSESAPRFSPDGRWLAFLSGRESKQTQVFLLDRRGGEAQKLTAFKADVSALEWSPDSRRLALIVADVDPDDPEAASDETKAKQEKPKHPKPIVIDRRQFLRDEDGFLREVRQHLYVFDVASKKATQLTSGRYDDAEPAWSPDGRWIAFSSNRTEDPDANQNTDIFLARADAAAGAGGPREAPRLLTTNAGGDTAPSWSPDGKWIAYVAGGDVADMWYAPSHVGLVAVADGTTRDLTSTLDRNVLRPRFSRDGRFVWFLLEEGGNQHLARLSLGGAPSVAAVERVVGGERAVGAYDLGPGGEVVILASTAERPNELFAASIGAGAIERRLTHANDELLAGLRLGRQERFQVKSADGTPIDAFLTYPPDVGPGGSGSATAPASRLPTILRLHGGPVSQFDSGWHLEWQLLAAHGYAVVGANPRGSSGYGRAFSRAIWADWGNLDFQDVMAAVDAAVAKGIADPVRLGVGGWSYGGILTNYVITKTTRFKAATSGASEVNFFADYGTDQYQYEWETELGLPWQNR